MQNQPPYTPGGPLSTGHYEFSSKENEKITLVGSRAKIWGFVAMGTGVLALVGLVVALLFKEELISHGLEGNFVTIFVVSLVPVVLTHLVIAMLYIGAGKSLEAVVRTQGNDVEHLMQSLDKLGTAFLVEFAVGMLAVVVSVGLGFQMAVNNLADQKAAELARAEAEAAAIAAATEEAEEDEDEGDTDEDGEDEEDAEEDEADEADDEDAEEDGEEDEGDTDEEEGEDEDGSGGAEDGEDGEDAEDAEDEAATPEPADAPAAG